MRPHFQVQEIKSLPFDKFSTCVQVNHDICSHDYRLRFTENTIGCLRECVLVCLETTNPSRIQDFVFPDTSVDEMKEVSLPILEGYMKLKNIEPKLANDM
ncbi:hypothetical protein CYY_000158 [Polysphondylium violaceum]|uniref:Uncharacterized protein n=1 Tax=Polysphondylium violaceum TaxID=133409 RepID=A0A8J4V0X1_9MYCE|nr:hypothetical protein CYY_008905 [Polysphondylium violaceum]KAF2078533.1 hypothetical protein CYY_000158 [Polysphondylium violaceum]